MHRIISALILAVTTATGALAAEPLALVDNPPDRHVVVKGDTLWGISGKFLKQPWRWPEIWQLNKDDIKNPHRIYPGDIVILDTSNGNPRLRLGKSVGNGAMGANGVVKLSPQEYSEPNKKEISSIPSNLIEPFLSRPLIIEPFDHVQSPRIVATQEDRVNLGYGDIGFVQGMPLETTQEKWMVYRPGKALKDPDTQETVAYEAFFLGHAQLRENGQPATIMITQAKEEIGRGDRLIPAPPATIVSYVPHAPDGVVDGKILSIYGGLVEGGKYSIISLNRGSASNLEVGHVLALYRKRVSTGYDEQDRRVSTPIPDERYAVAFVFRVFERVAYALVMETTKPVLVGDSVRNP